MINQRMTAESVPPSWIARLGCRFAIPVATLLACVATVGVMAGPAVAADSSAPYGQVARIGGFDSCWFDNGNYDGQGLTNAVSGCTANESYPGEDAESQGKFVDPSGFAVDSQDSNALYVLDRTSEATATTGTTATSWRIQKLDDQGDVLGSTTFNLVLPSTNTTDNLQLTSLAVDHNTGEVYSLVDDYNGTADVPYEIVAWSTTPDTAKQLVAPTGLTQDTALFTATGAAAADANVAAAGPGIVSSNSQLNGGPLAGAIYNPQGIAIDDQAGGQDDLAVEASGTPKQFTTTNNVGKSGTGPTIVQQVATSGSSVGTLGDYWSSATGLFDASGTLITNDSLSTTAPSPDPNASSTETELGPAGISASASGGLTVLLDDSHSGTGDSSGAGGSGSAGGVGYNVDVVALGGDLSTEKILASSVNKSGSTGTSYLWTDTQAIDTAGAQPPYAVNSASPSLTAGPLVIGLSTGLYAANYSGSYNPSGDSAAPADSTGSHDPYYWGPDSSSGSNNPGNYGIRLLDPALEANGSLSNASAPLTSVYDTLGNSTSGGPCQIADSASSLAAGANGAIFDLTRGVDSSYGTTTPYGPEGVAGRQIIELAPGAAQACPSAQGTFDVSDPSVDSGAEQQVTDDASQPTATVQVGDTVTFDGSTIDYPTTSFADRSATATTATPFAFEWDPGDGSSTMIDATTGTTLKWPSYTQTYTYTSPGPHTVTLTVLGDYGTYQVQGTVDVDAPGTGTAVLPQSPVTGTAGQQVCFDGSGSAPYTDPSNPDADASISTYNWNFGDGTPGAIQNLSSSQQGSDKPCYTYSKSGSYTVTLSVTDDDGQKSASVTETVKITAGAPTASASASPASVTTGQSVSFTASAKAGTGSSISGYSWDFGDGATASTATTTHIYSTPGTYTVKLTVTDADGQAATSTTTVTVTTAPSNPSPKPPAPKVSPKNVVLKAGVKSTTLTLQFRSVKIGARLTVKLSEPKVKKAKTKSAKVGSNHVLKFATGKLPVGATKIRFYETVGKGKHAKLKLVKTETVHVKAKK